MFPAMKSGATTSRTSPRFSVAETIGTGAGHPYGCRCPSRPGVPGGCLPVPRVSRLPAPACGHDRIGAKRARGCRVARAGRYQRAGESGRRSGLRIDRLTLRGAHHHEVRRRRRLSDGGLHAPGTKLPTPSGAGMHALVHLTRVTSPEVVAAGPLDRVRQVGDSGKSRRDTPPRHSAKTLYDFPHVIMSGRVPPERSADSPMKPNHARQLANPVAGWPFCLGGRGGA